MIETSADLRGLYACPGERAVRKQLDQLDAHCMRFIELSPFLVIATGNDEGRLDASPRGGEPGFVKVLDPHTLLLPDAPGNNRLDSMSNLVASAGVGLLFLIPGVDETLRVNGRARLRDDLQTTRRFTTEKRTPKLVIEIVVEEAYLHCAKALMRSSLWAPEARNDRSVLPTMGQMIGDQTGSPMPAESHEQMVARYAPDL